MIGMHIARIVIFAFSIIGFMTVLKWIECKFGKLTVTIIVGLLVVLTILGLFFNPLP